jgi:hypothetical protein
MVFLVGRLEVAVDVMLLTVVFKAFRDDLLSEFGREWEIGDRSVIFELVFIK